MLQFLKKSLKANNTFQLDVTADRVIVLEDQTDIHAAVSLISSERSKFMILGGGSNVLFSGDYSGTILHNRLKGIALTGESDDHYLVRAASGEVWDDFVEISVKKGWFGLENLSLIPGTVGAAPLQNIGAYGQEAGNLIDSVTFYDFVDDKNLSISGSECGFGYRESIFKRELKGRVFITGVTFKLDKKFKPLLGYKDVSARFTGRPETEIAASEVRQAIIEIRKAKLPDPALLGNAGSFFKNPEVSVEEYNALSEKHPGLPGYQIGERVKLSAGWLIQEAGWKGKKYKNCGTYSNQALVLVNYGDAHPKEILELKEMIKADVLQKFSVYLEEEVNIIA